MDTLEARVRELAEKIVMEAPVQWPDGQEGEAVDWIMQHILKFVNDELEADREVPVG
jgi:hypothetical protein